MRRAIGIGICFVVMMSVSCYQAATTSSARDRFEDRVVALLIANDQVGSNQQISLPVKRRGLAWIITDTQPYAPLNGGELRLIHRPDGAGTWSCVKVPVGCDNGTIDNDIAQRADDRYQQWRLLQKTSPFARN